MALQNRVDPYGEIVAVTARGTLTGNRGVLHDANRRIVRNWGTRRWIACRLDYGDRRRPTMTPGRWTELFFLDEATALSAGHRPCFFCRFVDASRFAQLWNEARGLGTRARADAIDRVLHAERTSTSRPRRRGDQLPLGTMVDHGGTPAVVVATGLRSWSFTGYAAVQTMPHGELGVITPMSTVEVLAAGYVPALHVSATGS